MTPFDLSPSRCHRRLAHDVRPALKYDGGPVTQWQARFRPKLLDLIGDLPGERVPLDPVPVWTWDHPLGRIEKLVFTAEPGTHVPAYLCLPHCATTPCPVMICLQGHTTGMHNSIGVSADDERTPIQVAGDRDLALQCLERGIAALCVEQRGFDVDRDIDYLETRPEVDVSTLGVMGNSTGGTVATYAAALLPRVRLAVPSCSLCRLEDSWLHHHLCACGHVPRLHQYGRLADVLGLFAPHPVIVVSGRRDDLLPFEGAERAFADLRGSTAPWGRDSTATSWPALKDTGSTPRRNVAAPPTVSETPLRSEFCRAGQGSPAPRPLMHALASGIGIHQFHHHQDAQADSPHNA